MNVYDIITFTYRIIIGLIAVLYLINIVKHQEFSKKFLGVFVALPFLLRLFNIK
jgi:hypothetical protein